MNIKSAFEFIAVMGGGLGMIWAGMTWITDQAKDYHDDAMEPVVESLQTIEQSAVVSRIRGLLEARCERMEADSWTSELQGILDEQLTKYADLTGREFSIGGCEDGRRVR